MDAGRQWLVDAFGCDGERLRSVAALSGVFDALVRDLALHPVAAPVWHVFPGEGGVTGFLLLSESHLACHTFPETGHAALDLYCCRERDPWPWREGLAALLGAQHVRVRDVPRGGTAP